MVRPAPHLSRWTPTNQRCRELFAKKKGIAPKQRDGKMVYEEETGEWVPKWGYKGKNKGSEGDWLVEIDDKKTDKEGDEGNPRKLGRDERKANIKLNERQQKKNDKKNAFGPKKGGVVKNKKPSSSKKR